MRARVSLKLGKSQAVCPRSGQSVSCGLHRRRYSCSLLRTVNT